jgi:hypothetical protein
MGDTPTLYEWAGGGPAGPGAPLGWGVAPPYQP